MGYSVPQWSSGLLRPRFPELRKSKIILSQANQTDTTLRKDLMDKN